MNDACQGVSYLINGPSWGDFNGGFVYQWYAAPTCNRSENDKSSIVRFFLDLCGIIEIGEILSWGGGSSHMSSQSTMRARPAATFAATSAVRCSIASGASAN